jgi:2-deoxy-D-gluconate 3-dehydrogenase
MPDAPLAPSFRLDGRVALVTAAGRGIGRATARALAGAGAIVVVNDVDADAAARVAADLCAAGAVAEAAAFDVAEEARVAEAVAAIAARRGSIDVLVNNAGVASRASAEATTREQWERTLAVNATGAFLCAREAGKRMLAAGRGAIVNVASVMGLVGRGLAPNGAYHASKGAMIAWTRALACEWAPRGVRVNAVAPGYVATPYVREAFAAEAAQARIVDRQAIGRLVEPAEVAAAILFLASDAASAITGATLPVDGGWTAG